LTEGYGVSLEGINKLARDGARLIITVDCGVGAREETLLAKSLGMDVIITDHHEPKETLPDAIAVLDAKAPGSGYPDDNLAGVGVALKLCHALAIKANKPQEFWTQYLDLAAVGTAADIVALVGENRVIAKLGFEQLSRTKNPGLRALISEQGLSGKPLSTSEVGFQIAPCINAVGRLGDPKRGVELLLTDDPAMAARFARELKAANIERRAIDKAMQEEAFVWVERNWDPARDYAIIIAQPKWHCGVVGIVASKVVERYHRPTLLFSINDEGVARGSGRSIPAVHLHKILGECAQLLESFGGHAAAAGMTIKQSNLEQFRECFNQAVKRTVTLEDMIPCIKADSEIDLKECTYPFFNMIRRLEPFGPGNARPLFLCRNLTHKYEPRIVGAKHLKMMVAGGGQTMDAVGFNHGHRFNEVKKALKFSLVFSLDENEWNGRKSLQMKVKGVDV
jgi:single-stranded-DNA-specific exonuclease